MNMYKAKLEQDEDGRWSAWIDALPGCAAWGYTQDEALAALQYAAEAYIEDMVEAGELAKQGGAVSESKVVHSRTYEARIKVLRAYALEDDDIEKVNEDSINDFWSFMKITGFSRQAGLVLLDSGDLRAVWRENDGHNIGLRFLGNQEILYVIFKRDAGGQITERAVGADSFDRVTKQIKDLDLLHFVKE